jgi:trehalose-6-phosphate synthase
MLLHVLAGAAFERLMKDSLATLNWCCCRVQEMKLLSYRGPAAAGGVSCTLTAAFSKYAEANSSWWHVEGSSLILRSKLSATKNVCNIAPAITEGHYRYCNNFLWPILHDLPQFAVYDQHERSCFGQFSLAIARNYTSASRNSISPCFVQDYQFALVPDLLGASNRSAMFWHVPWPAYVNPLHVDPLLEVGRGMLGASFLGFHTTEYAHNFLSFIDSYLPSANVDFAGQEIVFRGRRTQIVVSPLGVDIGYWNELQAEFALSADFAKQQPAFVLSVDRADYTKGIIERLDAIERFYESHPEMLGQVHFVMVCHRTRMGLQHFDSYWTKCKTKGDAIAARWARPGWRPIVWIEQPLHSLELVRLYSQAAAVWVSPIRDGLNLVAKEYSAVQQRGALLLSRGAGVWRELGEFAIPVDPGSSEVTVSAILQALNMSRTEKHMRSLQTKRRLRSNTLANWWHQYSSLLRNTHDSMGNLVTVAKSQTRSKEVTIY